MGAMATVLGARAGHLTVNGQPTFLLGVGYFGGLGAPEGGVRRDLDDLQRCGVNWVRIWANWRAGGVDVAAIDRAGNPREPFLSKLQWFVKECDRRGLVVGVSLGRGSEHGEVGLTGAEAHRRAVMTLLKALGVFGNWYLDLATHRNLRDARFVCLEEVKALRDAVKAEDSQRLVTVTHSGDLRRTEFLNYLLVAGVDFICVQRPCTPKAGRTDAWTTQYRAWLREAGWEVPILYHESLRRGLFAGWTPTATDLLQDLHAAWSTGAAGWCFVPNDRVRQVFDLRRSRLWDQLDEEERAFLQRAREVTGQWASAFGFVPETSSLRRN